jgi:tetratricopeptide (TPR) repeat protein
MKPGTVSDPLVAQRRRRIWIAADCAMLILAPLIVYSDSFHGPFIFDDISAIAQAAAKQPWRAWHILIGLRPVVEATLALNYAIGGHHETGYHVVNLCIHILATLALFGVIRRTLTLPSFGGRFDESTATSLAFCAALLWAIHPLQTQAVTYVIQRLESLAGLFYLLTLYCFIRAASSARPRAWQAAAVAACALGMGSKEVMVSAPPIVLLYDRCFVAGAFGEALRRRRGLYIGLAATWLLLARSAVEAVGPHAMSAGFQLHQVTPFQYARSEPGVILHYLSLALWPAGLCLDYAWPVANSVGQIAPGAIIVGALLAATIWALARRRKWGFVGAWFFLILAPSSSVMPINDLEVEHRMYLPLAAVVVAVILGGYLAWQRWACRRARSEANASGGQARADEGRRQAGQILGAVLIVSAAVGLGRATFLRNKDYSTVMGIWSDTVLKAPRNARALNNMGWELRNIGDYQAALDCLNRALELRPRYADAYNNRAYTYASMKRFDEALNDCNKAIEFNPDLAAAYNNRGNLYEQLGETQKALEDYNRAIKLRPDHAAAYNNRGNLYEQRGEFEKALDDYDRALELEPDNPKAYNNRGVVKLKMRQVEDALKDFDKAIEIRPDDPIPYRCRASAHYALKEYAKALADLDTFERLHGKPDAAFRKLILQGASGGTGEPT